MSCGLHECVASCGQMFSSRRGLTKHKGRCKKAMETYGNNQRVAQLNREKAKKRKLDLIHGTGQIGDVEALMASSSHSLVVPATGHPQVGLGNDTTESPGPPPEQIQLLGRGKRIKRQSSRRPRLIVDKLPLSLDPPFTSQSIEKDSPNRLTQTVIPPAEVPVSTGSNKFGLHRTYPSIPPFRPEEASSLLDLSDMVRSDTGNNLNIQAPPITPLSTTGLQESAHGHDKEKWFQPCKSAAACRLLNWFWAGTQTKSMADLDDLVQNVILADDFKLEDLNSFSAKGDTSRLDSRRTATEIPENSTADSPASAKDAKDHLSPRDGWKEQDVTITVPDGRAHAAQSDILHFKVSGLHSRSLIEVIKAAFQSRAFFRFHLTPYKQFWTSPSASESINTGGVPQRVYSELYSSDIWLEEHAKLQQERREIGDVAERVIAGLMFWSDSTRLTNFGTASLWPIYLFFGNQSKYERAKPSEHACHHVAYIPQLPEEIVQFFRNSTGHAPSDEVLRHCRRELMQAILAILFNDQFEKAHREGLLIKCGDNIERRIFPRIFTWSADYKEKVLLASIKQLGNCPCTRCLTPLSLAHELGTARSNKRARTTSRMDTIFRRVLIESSREAIFRSGKTVNCAEIRRMLDTMSLLPIENTLSRILSEFGLNFYQIFVVDFLHEVELGVWKMVYIHLIRLLHVLGPDVLALFNERFRAVPTFGDAIRKFTGDASAMDKPAARHFEDLLQCAIPVFEGLFPVPHNKIVLDLLFSISTWHALAKLRLHTDDTLTLLEKSTRNLGAQLRHFKKETCSVYMTSLLPSEASKQERQKERQRQRHVRKPGEESDSATHARRSQDSVRPLSIAGVSSSSVPEDLTSVLAPNPSEQTIRGEDSTIGTKSRKRKGGAGTTSKNKGKAKANSQVQVSLEALSASQLTLPSPKPHEGVAPATQVKETTAFTEMEPNLCQGNQHEIVTEVKGKPAKKKKEFNLNTYKMHALEHHAETIRRYGTTDSYSTQPGELEHRKVKGYYARTNKNSATTQITKLERREHCLRQLMQNAPPVHDVSTANPRKRKIVHTDFGENSQASANLRHDLSCLSEHYHMSHSEAEAIYLPIWLRERKEDPAVKDFYDRLKDHILGRLLKKQYDGDETSFSGEERNTLILENNQIFKHHVLRINYTSYDMRRCQDSINPRTHPDVMLLACEDASDENSHPFCCEGSQVIDFLWVRWFGSAFDVPSGWKAKRLYPVGFVPQNDCVASFGFLDPNLVLRGVHLLPAFHYGRTQSLLSKSPSARKPEENDEDWVLYYVGKFVDRDMFMRFVGNGVGHRHVDVQPLLKSPGELQDEEILHLDDTATADHAAHDDTYEFQREGEDDSDLGIEEDSDCEGNL